MKKIRKDSMFHQVLYPNSRDLHKIFPHWRNIGSKNLAPFNI